jgi:hypothetical protein
MKYVKSKPIAIWNVVVQKTIGTANLGGKVLKRWQNGRFKGYEHHLLRSKF